MRSDFKSLRLEAKSLSFAREAFFIGAWRLETATTFGLAHGAVFGAFLRPLADVGVEDALAEADV